MTFKEYCKKYCPDYNKSLVHRAKALGLYNMYQETVKVSTDMPAAGKLTVEDFKKAQRALEKANVVPMQYMLSNGYWSEFSLAPLPQTVAKCPEPCVPAKLNKQKGNNPMYVDNDKHIESSKINYLQERATTVLWTKEGDLDKTFGFVDDAAPGTPEDFIARIQAGKFVLNDETKKKHVYDPSRYIRWRDPAVKEDEQGRTAARKILLNLYQDTKDTIAIGTPVEGLAAVKALDAWTPTVTA